jgi:hypothetical protein
MGKGSRRRRKRRRRRRRRPGWELLPWEAWTVKLKPYSIAVKVR